jgi:hypothetical protein
MTRLKLCRLEERASAHGAALTRPPWRLPTCLSCPLFEGNVDEVNGSVLHLRIVTRVH